MCASSHTARPGLLGGSASCDYERALMARLTVWLLGFEVFTISNEETAEAEAAALSGGLLGSTPVGFTARYELPDGAKRPEWDDDEVKP